MMRVLPVVWRYAATSGFELSGDRVGLHAVAESLRDAATVSEREVWHDSNDRGATPYDVFIKRMVVRQAPSKVRITREDDVVVVTGRREELNVLADNIDSLVHGAERGDHLHIEYFPDHFYLDQGSEPLVVRME